MKNIFKYILSIVLVFLVIKIDAQKKAGLALTPPMGWNSWNTFAVNINEELIKGVADKMVSSGMKDAGYTYLVLDDGWMSMERDSITGNLIADPEKFPSGIEALISYVHSKRLKFGLYNCAGTKTCAGYPGTRGYEFQDARYYAKLGIDYLKFDWCNTEGINAKEVYTTMSKALAQTNQNIIFSLCEWGENKPWEWAAPIGQLWRTTGDIYPCFDCVFNHGTWSAFGVLRIADLRKNIRQFAGSDHWNDPDMLEVGNGMTEAEDRSHFSLWAMMAAPLIAGNDIRKMSAQTQQILTNKEVIKIDQDSLGIQGFKYKESDSIQIWCKPLAKGDWAICFINRSAVEKNINFNWQGNIMKDSVFNFSLNPTKEIYQIQDVWNNTSSIKRSINTSENFKAFLPSHDVFVLRLKRYTKASIK